MRFLARSDKMSLREQLKKIMPRKETKLKVICKTGETFVGGYDGFVGYLDNEPEEDELDLLVDGFSIGFLDSEVEQVSQVK